VFSIIFLLRVAYDLKIHTLLIISMLNVVFLEIINNQFDENETSEIIFVKRTFVKIQTNA